MHPLQVDRTVPHVSATQADCTRVARLEEAHREAARQAGEVAGEWRLRLAQSEEGHRALQADLAAQLDALQQRCEAQQ